MNSFDNRAQNLRNRSRCHLTTVSAWTYIRGCRHSGQQLRDGDPKHAVKGRQNGALLLSLKRRYLHSQRRVLDGNGLMAAEGKCQDWRHCETTTFVHVSTRWFLLLITPPGTSTRGLVPGQQTAVCAEPVR